MIFLIIYLLGWIPCAFVIPEIFAQKTLGAAAKIGLSLLVLLLSWVGYFAWRFALEYFITNNIRL